MKVMPFGQGADSLQEKNTLFRFLHYLIPYKSSIILAMICALVASVCELGPIQILADTLNSLKLLEDFSQSTTIRFFSHREHF